MMLIPGSARRHLLTSHPDHGCSSHVLVFLTPLPRTLQLPDVCYSWWVLASLKIIGRIHWIDKSKLRTFILACQDEETGGFADRPGDMVSAGAGLRESGNVISDELHGLPVFSPEEYPPYLHRPF